MASPKTSPKTSHERGDGKAAGASEVPDAFGAAGVTGLAVGTAGGWALTVLGTGSAAFRGCQTDGGSSLCGGTRSGPWPLGPGIMASSERRGNRTAAGASAMTEGLGAAGIMGSAVGTAGGWALTVL